MFTPALHSPLLRLLALAGLMGLSACSTVIEGRSQKISVNSSPEGAQCTLKEADEVVGRLTTPGYAEVRKSKNDLMVLCYKEGYDSVATRNHSDYAISSLGNMVMGQYGFVGNAVDSLTGAANKYDSTVFVTLARSETPVAFPVPPGAPPVIQVSEQVATSMSMQVPMPGAAVASLAPATTVALVAAAPAVHLSGAATAAVDNDAPYIKEARATAAPVEGVEARDLEQVSHVKGSSLHASHAAAHAPKAQTPSMEAALDSRITANLAPKSAYPAIKASAQMAKAAEEVYVREQPVPLAYAQAEAEMPRRPPFDITQ